MDMPEVNDRYLNLAMINIGEAIVMINNARQRGHPPGDDYKPARLALAKAAAALQGINFSLEQLVYFDKEQTNETTTTVKPSTTHVHVGVRVGDRPGSVPYPVRACSEQRRRWWGWGQSDRVG